MIIPKNTLESGDIIKPKCSGFGKIKALLLYKNTDIKYNNGIAEVKRKYGKFDRTPIIIK